MKDAKKIKFDRSFESKKAIDFLKKHVEKLFEIIRISNNLNLLNDNELYSLILLFDKLTRDIQNFHDLFFDPKIIKISKKNPKDKYIKKREEENIILNKKYNILISLNHTSDKKQKTILIETLLYLKHLFNSDIIILQKEFENINNIMTLKEVYDIIDKISAKIKN